MRGTVLHAQAGWREGKWLSRAAGRLDAQDFGSGEALASVLFHVPNLRACTGEGIRDATGNCSGLRRAVMEGGGWRITLDQIGEHARRHVGKPRDAVDDGPCAAPNQEFLRSLRESGGYGITHVGRIERTDEQVFSSDDVKDLEEALFRFLSFCRGAWTGPLLAVGLDENGNQAWEEYRDWKVERWRRVHFWYRGCQTDVLASTFSGFVRRWKDKTWTDVIKHAVHWYVESNMCAGAVEGGIILSQAAFELLAWTLLVEEQKAISPNGFEKLPASDQIRLLLHACNIPTAVPESLTALVSAAKALKWTDGPQAIAETRNALVHPNPKKRRRLDRAGTGARIDAWSLALWYLELALLRLFDYNGSHFNRLQREGWAGDPVERVPWANA